MGAPKFRDFFITCFESADCYKNIESIIKSKCNYKLYGYILHNKDIEEDGTPKRKHYHIVMELKNPVTMQSMIDKFKGAHIEKVMYKKSAYAYLIHGTIQSHEDGKHQYDVNEIISNNLDQVKTDIQSFDNELFYENRFLRYIAEGTITPYQFVKRFGLMAYKQYYKAYIEVYHTLQTDTEMQRDLELEIQHMKQERLKLDIETDTEDFSSYKDFEDLTF